METYIDGRFWCVPNTRIICLLVRTKVLGDGGAYPECHIAQYPLGMGTKKVCGATCVPRELVFNLILGIFWQYSSFASGQ